MVDECKPELEVILKIYLVVRSCICGHSRLLAATIGGFYLLGCQLADSRIVGSLTEHSPPPSVYFNAISRSVGNSSTNFSFNLVYEHTAVVNVAAEQVKLQVQGGIICGSPSISGGSSLTPTINVTNCVGDGSFQLLVLPGTGQTEGSVDPGATSLSVTVDNTAPSVAIGAPTPNSGDVSDTFLFPVIFTGAFTNNLQASDVTVNGSACDLPIILNGDTSTPSVVLSNCRDTNFVGISIQGDSSSDEAGNGSTSSLSSSTVNLTNPCPIDYVEVPSLAGYTANNFCIMKYEAKVERDSDKVLHNWGCDIDSDSSTGTHFCDFVADNWVIALLQPSTPTSVATGRPWRKIDRDQAISECRSINTETGDLAIDGDVNGDGTYDLVTNDEWQTLVRNIELVPGNWEENLVGGVSTGNGGSNANRLNRGHSDGAPSESLVANSDDSQGCVGTGEVCTGGALGNWNLEKRTHTLSNGKVIWDVSGNVWEWVKDDVGPTDNYDSSGPFYQITIGTHTSSNSLNGGTTTMSRTAKDQFGPLGDFTSLFSVSDGGLGYFWSGSSGSVLRGGGWFNSSGIFGTSMNDGPTVSNSSYGFRCTFVASP